MSSPCIKCGMQTYYALCELCKNRFPVCPKSFVISMPSTKGKYNTTLSYQSHTSLTPILSAFIDGKWVWHEFNFISKYPQVYKITVAHDDAFIIYRYLQRNGSILPHPDSPFIYFNFGAFYLIRPQPLPSQLSTYSLQAQPSISSSPQSHPSQSSPTHVSTPSLQLPPPTQTQHAHSLQQPTSNAPHHSQPSSTQTQYSHLPHPPPPHTHSLQSIQHTTIDIQQTSSAQYTQHISPSQYNKHIQQAQPPPSQSSQPYPPNSTNSSFIPSTLPTHTTRSSPSTHASTHSSQPQSLQSSARTNTEPPMNPTPAPEQTSWPQRITSFFKPSAPQPPPQPQSQPVATVHEESKSQGDKKKTQGKRNTHKKEYPVGHPANLYLPNVGSTCYLNSAIRLLYACDFDWGAICKASPNNVTKLFKNFLKDESIDIVRFVDGLEDELDKGLRHCSDSRQFLAKLMNKFDRVILDAFQFKGVSVVTYCVNCNQKADPRPVLRPYNYVYISHNVSVQAAFESAFHKNRDCMECPCPPEIQERNQYENFRVSAYPSFILLFTTQSDNSLQLKFSPRLKTSDSASYELIGKVISLDDYRHSVACIKFDKEWFVCDDQDVFLVDNRSYDLIKRSDVLILLYKRILE